MNSLLAIGLVCATAIVLTLVMSGHQVSMYREFNKQYMAAQIVEIELQQKYKDQNITVNVYEPPVGFL